MARQAAGYSLIKRHLYSNRVTLRRIINILMRLNAFAYFFFFVGMEQNFTRSTQYLLLDIGRYTATVAFVAMLILIILKIFSDGYVRRMRWRWLITDVLYMIFMLALVIINANLRIFFEGQYIQIV